jgi:hypothetical protein
MGPWLLVVLAAGLVAMAIMLVGIQFIKSLFPGEPGEQGE